MAPTWDAFWEETQGQINVARVDCTSEKGKPVCGYFKVRGFPTLLLFPVGENEHYSYKGDRTVEAFKDWVFEEQWKNTKPTKNPRIQASAGTFLN